MKVRVSVAAVLLSLASVSAIADIVVPMTLVDEKGVGASVGQITISESAYGLVFSPTLTGMAPGMHGFHMHANASCMPKNKDGKMVAALGAGGHFDPQDTKRHGTPWGDGHLGDLPPLFVDASGNASQPVLAPRLKMTDMKGHALMIHAGGDNYSDRPAALGGGGARMACGVSM